MKALIVLVFIVILTSTGFSQAILSTPDSNSVERVLPLTFKWKTVASDSLYQIQISTSATMSPIIVQDSTLTDTTKTTGYLANSTIYYWRVRAKILGVNHPATWAAYSNIWKFATTNVTTLVTPDTAATEINIPTKFVWRKVTGTGILYNIQISTSSSFTDYVTNVSTLTDTTYTQTQLALHKMYYWRVRYDSVTWRGYSHVFNFTTTGTDSLVTSLIAPANGARYYQDTIRFAWHKRTANDSVYGFQLNASPTFAGLGTSLVQSDTTLVVVGTAVNGTVLYWRVRALNKANVWFSYSPTWSFRAKVDSPTVVTLYYPNDLEKRVDTTLILKWFYRTTDSVYKVFVSSKSTFSDTVSLHTVAVPYDTVAVSSGRTYWWKVKPLNSAVTTGAYSPARRFTTKSVKHY
jgi:hypothetical protein